MVKSELPSEESGNPDNNVKSVGEGLNRGWKNSVGYFLFNDRRSYYR